MMRNAQSNIETMSDLPSDGCITVKDCYGTRRRGYHVERVIDAHWVDASPMSITSGRISGDATRLHLRFGLDAITTMEV